MNIKNRRKKMYKLIADEKNGAWFHYMSSTGIQISMKSYPPLYK